MTNQQKTTAFFMNTPVTVHNEILAQIADRYGITRGEAFEEVNDRFAEHLCDYLVGNIRTATMALMQKKGLF